MFVSTNSIFRSLGTPSAPSKAPALQDATKTVDAVGQKAITTPFSLKSKDLIEAYFDLAFQNVKKQIESDPVLQKVFDLNHPEAKALLKNLLKEGSCTGYSMAIIEAMQTENSSLSKAKIMNGMDRVQVIEKHLLYRLSLLTWNAAIQKETFEQNRPLYKLFHLSQVQVDASNRLYRLSWKISNLASICIGNAINLNTESAELKTHLFQLIKQPNQTSIEKLDFYHSEIKPFLSNENVLEKSPKKASVEATDPHLHGTITAFEKSGWGHSLSWGIDGEKAFFFDNNHGMTECRQTDFFDQLKEHLISKYQRSDIKLSFRIAIPASFDSSKVATAA